MRARVYSACTVQVRREFDTNTRGEFVTNTRAFAANTREFATKAPTVTRGAAAASHNAMLLRPSLAQPHSCPRDPRPGRHTHHVRVTAPGKCMKTHRALPVLAQAHCRQGATCMTSITTIPHTDTHSRLRQTRTRLFRIRAASFPALTPPCWGAAAWLCARCSSTPSSRLASSSADCCARHDACQNSPTGVCGFQFLLELLGEHASCRVDDTWGSRVACAWGVRT